MTPFPSMLWAFVVTAKAEYDMVNLVLLTSDSCGSFARAFGSVDLSGLARFARPLCWRRARSTIFRIVRPHASFLHVGTRGGRWRFAHDPESSRALHKPFWSGFIRCDSWALALGPRVFNSDNTIVS
jgi:hypothetical protein